MPPTRHIAAKQADALLGNALAYLRAVGKPNENDITRLVLNRYHDSDSWYRGFKTKDRDALELLRKAPFALGYYFRELRGLRWVAEEAGGSSFKQSDLYDAAVRICMSVIASASRFNAREVVEECLNDADYLMTNAAAEGDTAAIRKISSGLLRTGAAWFEWPSPYSDNEDTVVSYRGNLILWQVSALARAGKHAEARRQLEELSHEEQKNQEVELIRRALVAASSGARGQAQTTFLLGLEQLDGPGIGFLRDMFADQPLVFTGAASFLAMMQDDFTCSRTTQLILAASASTGVIGQLDGYLLEIAKREASMNDEDDRE